MSLFFISHSSHDAAAAAELRAWLEDQGHRSVFLDFDPERGIPAGRDWEQELYRNLRACRAVIVLCSARSMASRWCFMEITHARALGKHLFPVRIDDAPLDGVLGDHQAIDLRHHPEDGYRRLWQGILAAGLDPADVFDWDGSRPPYPGLLAFSERDAAVYFGREREIGDGLDLLNRVRRLGDGGLVMVLGASGTGKSSLVRAGLLPRLRRDPERWLVIDPIRARDDPAGELAAALSKAFARTGGTVDAASIRQRLLQATAPAAAQPVDDDPRAASRRFLARLQALEASLPTGADARVARHLRLARTAAAGGEDAGELPAPAPDAHPLLALAADLRRRSGRDDARVLLVIDQLEELLDHPDDHPASRFLRLLRAAFEHPGGPVLVLATLRSDFLATVQRTPAWLGVRYQSLALGPMPAEGIAQIVERPAAVAGIELEAGLVQALVADATTEDALPLLAFALRELNERHGADRLLQVDEYRRRLGGLQGAVAKAADDLLAAARPDADQMRSLRDAFLAMARITDDGRFARRPARWQALPAAAQPLLERFVAARLLVARGDADSGERTLEVAHEALFRSWRTLARWLEESLEALRLHQELRAAARAWRQNAEDESYHWQRGRLLRAGDLRDQGQLQLTDEELAFLAASEAAEQRAEARRRRAQKRRFQAALAVAAALLVVAGWAFLERRAAQRQLVTAMARLAQSGQLPLDRGLLLAVEASRLGDTFETRTSLLNLLARRPRLKAFLPGHRGLVWSVALSGDGATLASGSHDRTVRRWDLSGDQPRALDTYRYPEKVLGVALGATPDAVDVGGDAGTFRLHTRPDQVSAKPPRGGVFSVGFAGDGTAFAAGGNDGTVLAVRAGQDTPLRCPPAQCHRGFVTAVAFGPDGLLASSSRDGTVKLWRLDDRALAPVETLDGFQAGARSVLFHPRRAGRLVVGEGSGRLTVLDRAAGQRITLDGHPDAVKALAFDADGSLLATGSVDGTLRLWHWPADDPGLEPVPGLAIEGLRGGVWSLALDAAGSTLVSGGRNATVRLFDLAAPATVMTLADQDWELRGVAFSDDGDSAFTGDLDGHVRRWDLRANRERLLGGQGLETPGEIFGIDLDSDGRTLAFAGSGSGNRVQLWDLGGGPAAAPERLGDWPGDDRWVWDVALARRCGLVAIAGERLELRLLDQDQTAIILGSVDDGMSAALDVTFEPATCGLVSGHQDGSIRRWDPATGQESAPVRAAAGDTAVPVNTLVWRADGGLLLAGDADGVVWLFDPDAPDAAPRRLAGHGSPVRSLALSPDGSTLAVGLQDHTIRVWRLSPAPPIALCDLIGHFGIVDQLAFLDDVTVLSGAEDRTVRRWDLRPAADAETARAAACRRAGRNLRLDEWRDVMGPQPYRCTCPRLPPGDGAAADSDGCEAG